MDNNTLSRPILGKNAYQTSHLLACFTVPLLRRLYHRFDGDMVQIMVLGEISMRNVSQFFRKGGAQTQEHLLDDVARRDQIMQPCNVLSISEATGIPRETVRRKVELLMKKGWLYKDANKYLFIDTQLGPLFAQHDMQTVQELLQLATKLQDLLKMSDTEKD
jgi:hypothetical protein